MFGIRYMATGQLVKRGGKLLRFTSEGAAWDIANRLTVAALMAGKFGDGFVAVPV